MYAMNRRQFLKGSLFSGAAVASGGCAALVGASSRSDGTIRIAHCGDPQLGFSKSGDEQAYFDDLERCEREIAAVNRLRPDLCFIAGDMVDHAPNLERDWPRLIRLFEVPVIVTPGNHDMGNELTKENVERFERVFGYEYRSVKVGEWRFISGNSQYWRPTGETVRKERYERWLKAELDAAKAKGEPVILGTHIPPFMRTMWEDDDYENYPKDDRYRRFGMYVDNGVKFYLAGHTHRVYMRAEQGIMVFNAETTCRNFDATPFGFRLLTIRADGSYSWDFQPI